MLGVEHDYLMYSKVSPHWTLVHNGAAKPPVKYMLLGGSKGGGCRGSGAAPPKLKIDVKLACKML